MIDAVIAWTSAHPFVAAAMLLGTMWVFLGPKGRGGSTVGMDNGIGGGGDGGCGDGGGDGD